MFVCLSICLNYQEIPVALTNEIKGKTSLNNGKFILDFSPKKYGRLYICFILHDYKHYWTHGHRLNLLGI